MPFCPRLMICEGFEDVQFFEQFITARSLPSFKIIDTSIEGSRKGGIGNLKPRLATLKLGIGNRFKILDDILIVIDSDNDPQKNFAKVRKFIEKAFPGNVPDRLLEKTTFKPRISVLAVPWADTAGSLESMCVEAAKSADRGVGGNTDNFMAVSHASNWDAVRQGKAWLRSNLAVRATDPFITLGNLFEHAQDLIPMQHSSFQRIADFLSTF